MSAPPRRRPRRARRRLAPLAAALAVAAAAGCTSYTGTPANQVREWASTATVGTNDADVVADVRALERSVRAGAVKDVTSNCAGLVYDTGTAYDNLPTPNEALTGELNAAYEKFFASGEACSSVTSVTAPGVATALADAADGLRLLDRPTRQLREDGAG